MAPCATCDFKTISEVQEKFRIMYAEDNFVKTEPSTPSAEFLRDFEFTREHINVFASEAARCEAIIFPVRKTEQTLHWLIYRRFLGRLMLCSKRRLIALEKARVDTLKW